MILRDYQRNAVDRVKAALDKRPILVAPTGSGKTVMAVALVQELGLPTLWLAHRKELIDQAASHLQSLGLWCGRIMSGYPTEPLAPVQVASVQTLVRRAMPPAKLIIIDESHHATAGSYSRVLENYPNASVAGLTATPFRLDGRGLGDVFGEIVVAAYSDDLCKAGVLHDPKVYAGKSPDLRRVKISMGDYALGELSRRANTDEQNADIVKTWLEKSPGRRTVAFAVDVEHSQAIIKAFRAAGIAAEHVDGTTPKDEREAILSRLRDAKDPHRQQLHGADGRLGPAGAGDGNHRAAHREPQPPSPDDRAHHARLPGQGRGHRPRPRRQPSRPRPRDAPDRVQPRQQQAGRRARPAAAEAVPGLPTPLRSERAVLPRMRMDTRAGRQNAYRCRSTATEASRSSTTRTSPTAPNSGG